VLLLPPLRSGSSSTRRRNNVNLYSHSTWYRKWGQVNLERVVGTHYFDGESSLQWNNYLYFIKDANTLADSATQKAKEVVERDRTYARKFVIAETELDSVLRPRIVQPTEGAKKSDVISEWAAVLKQPHLIEAVLGDYSLPERMKLIEGIQSPPKSARQKALSIQGGALLPTIRKFIIKQFRTCPSQRNFDFGDVNLLFGVNGTGKTSLLEAIELYYCGKTKRNPKTDEEYEFVIELQGGKSETITHDRPLQVFRDRDRQWYGIREEKSSKLCDGFGRFNFLDTDAALELSRSTDRIDEHLAKLLVGSDSAATWQVIEKMSDRVELEVRDAERQNALIDPDLKLLNKQLAESSTVKTESDSLRTALVESLRRNKWTVDDHRLESVAGELVEQLAGLTTVARQATALSWLDSPVTLDRCDRYCSSVDAIIKACGPTVARLEALRMSQAQLIKATKQNRQALNLVGELARLVESGMESRAAELAKQRGAMTTNANLVAGIDDETLRIVGDANGSLVVTGYRDSAVVARERVERALSAAKRAHEDFAKLRNRSLALAQELRQVAARILEESPSDECPLCHTKFQPSELARHMSAGIDEHLEALGQKLLGDMRRFETELSEAAANEKAASRIVAFCLSARLPLNTDLKGALKALKHAQDALDESRRRSEVLSAEIKSLESQGLSRERLDEICTELNTLGYKIAERSRDATGSLRNEIEESTQSSSHAVQKNAQEEARLRKAFDDAVRSIRPTATDPQMALAELSERLATTQNVQSRVMPFLSRFSWQPSRAISEWMVEAEAVRGIAAQLQTALGKERVASKTRADATKRRDDLQEQQKRLNARLKRLGEAKSVLSEIRTKHSLEAVTKSALQENRKGIESIFGQIHSPAEFEGIGQDWTLVRKLDNEETELTRISTGQRSAFALSVFLAQNAELTAGPPIILIDDPIAHVDDLNALSFLDYLREIALTGTRQIFFATASDKLASLFERKFDFLGDKRFRRHNLRREVGAA
jgi:exonuclease SbcC